MDFVQLRSGVYYYRRRLPRDLSRLLGQNELVRSIGRGDRHIAISRARDIDRAVVRTLQKLQEMPPLDQRTARSLFRSWVDHQFESEVPDHQKSSPFEPPAITATTERLGLHQMAERLAFLLGIEMKSSSQGGLPSALGPLSLARSTPSSALLTLAQAIDMFKAEHGPSISPKTRVEYNQTLRLALEYWGPDLPIPAISKSEARDLKSLLVRLPANMAQKFPGKSLRHAVDLAAKKQAPVINAKTINKKLSNLTTLFHWLKEQGYIEENPFTGLSVRDIAHRRRRDPFTPQQLSAIFSAQLSGSNDCPQKGTKWQELENIWIPFIALFTGMRLGEIAQLTTEDIRQVQGIWVLDVHDRGSNHLKTSASNRLVPIHQELIKLGLLEYLTEVEGEGYKRLFPALSKASDGYESSAFSKRFARYLYRCGVKTDRRLTFHSFRHTFKDMMREAGIDRSVQDTICGHDDGSVQAGYGRGYSVTALSRAIDSLPSPLDLTRWKISTRTSSSGHMAPQRCS